MAFFSFFAENLGIDLGTANTLICSVENGILLNEPSVVALSEDYTGKKIPCEFGKEAKLMLGKTHSKIEAIRPMKDGTISDFKAAGEMINHFVQFVCKNKFLFGPMIIVCVPSGSTPVERKSIQEAIEMSGARDVFLIEEPIAAAIGANLSIMEPTGSIIVDIGGGTTEIGIISLGGIVYGKSIKIAGDRMNEEILLYIKKKFNLLISESIAEKIKINIGSACAPLDGTDGEVMEVRGRDLKDGLPKELIISQKQISESLKDVVFEIIEAIKIAFEKTPPDLSSDIVEKGIVLSGGGSLLKNLDYVISKETGLPVYVAEDSLLCVVNGIRKVLMDTKTYKNVLFKQD